MTAVSDPIGVLALQGAFREHRQSLDRLGFESVEVRLPRHLEGIGGLIIPGGESTTIGKLLVEWRLLEPIRKLALDGLPVWGTCAGAILMADRIEERGREMEQPLLGLLPMTAVRNAFGRQKESFEANLAIEGIEDTYDAVFIRAPLLLPREERVRVLASVDGHAVFVVCGNLMATSFHPELTKDDRIHRFFLSLIERAD